MFNQTPESKAADDALNAALPNAAGDQSRQEVTSELRLARVLEYQAESLSKPDALEACVGSTNASLMQIVFRLADTISEAMAETKVENYSRVAPAMDALLRGTRQVDRYTHCEMALSESRRKAEDAKRSVQHRGLPMFSNNKIHKKSRG